MDRFSLIYTHPPMSSSSSKLPPAPPGWEIRMSKRKGVPFYFCLATKEARWEFPEEAKPAAAEDGGAHKAKRTREEEAETVQASHILAKHKDSRRPKNWKNEDITRTKEEARKLVEQWREDLVAGRVAFADLARRVSDCSSASRGGDLGRFSREKMQAKFSEAAFALQVTEMSGLVETDSGVHIILRTA
eukprot:m.68775 g.68775  ORF g.68775 m.68775 type:complete len:189 (-) comp12791_c1_seq1:30-596(-)